MAFQKRMTGFALIQAFVTVGVLLVAAPDPGHAQQKSTFVNIGTAGIGGAYYPTGGYICNLLNRSRQQYGHNIRCTVESTSGAAANLKALHAGDLDVILTQSDTLIDAWEGTGNYKDTGPVKKSRYGFATHVDAFHVATLPNKGVSSFAGLKGKVVNTSNPGTGTEVAIYKAFEKYGVSAKQHFSQETKLTVREQAQALCDGKIDAFLYLTGLGAGTMQEAASTCNAIIVDWWDDAINGLVGDKRNGYLKMTFPVGVYPGQTKEVTSWGAVNMLILSETVPEEVGYFLTKAVFDNFEEFKKQAITYASITREWSAREGQAVPYHPGSLRYFKEVGLVK
ncbi:MAG: TAXI family TRAP transporter solute-binding subunit [Alphaproteobacteria bacterium]|nr:TAXI family TRAP transporter solute-binding subunit [Alphaproteobacteria bacterium]